MSKIVKRIILDRLKGHTEELNILSDELFGFRSLHHTEQQVLRILEYGARGLCRNQRMAYLFLNVARP